MDCWVDKDLVILKELQSIALCPSTRDILEGLGSGLGLFNI